MLKIKNLNKIYNLNSSFFERKKSFLALNNISFDLKKNETLSIIGESGSGKSTLAKIICRLVPFDSGSVEIDGKNISDYTGKEYASIVQMIFQNPYASFNPKLTIGYSLLEAVDENTQNKKELIKEKLKLVDIDDDIFSKYPHQFSGGQRQRIAIARALLREPKILIADEPFSSLDVINQNLIMRIFEKIKEGKKTTLIFITHDISAAKKISDKILEVKHGNLYNIKTAKAIVG